MTACRIKETIVPHRCRVSGNAVQRRRVWDEVESPADAGSFHLIAPVSGDVHGNIDLQGYICMVPRFTDIVFLCVFICLVL